MTKNRATLTDLKNKIGTVLHIVDTEGDVIITSYGVDRYRITPIEPELESPNETKEQEDKKNPIEEINTTEPKTEEVQVKQDQQVKMKEAAAPIKDRPIDSKIVQDIGDMWIRNNKLEKKWISNIKVTL